ncbi:hypothetical protein [Thermococcus sp.]|uniref:hypothetical protein n=1 Tax=Thermococcus sp. TaxID=35749 RepID=UPI0026171475|nr:hypothetical protein [Thermococcus sp.]
MKMLSVPISPYVRLPSETGKGIEFGKIPSRIKVAGDIKTFLQNALKQENQPLVLFLIGEWGEGKTTLYDRYLKSQEVQEEIGGIYVMDIQTDIFVKYAKRIFEKELFPIDNIDPGYRLLAALFLALRNDHAEELKNLIGEPFPGERSYDSLRDYVNKCLKLIKDVTIKKEKVNPFVIFIDEFETFALIAEDEILKEFIIEGLTKIINGKIDSLFENKTSVLHLIFSVTPPAFARLRALAGDIEGRFMQRIKRIYLYPLDKQERFQFTEELIKYMWNNPHMNINSIFLPPSLLNPIIHSTIGNTRALQQAITLLLSRKLSKNSSPIEYREIVEFLSDETNDIVVAGVRATLMNNQVLKTIYAEIEKLQDREEKYQEILKIKEVFEFIVSTFGTVHIHEMIKYLGYESPESEASIKYYLEQLNKLFRRSKPLGASIGTNSFVYKCKKYEINDTTVFSNALMSSLYEIIRENPAIIPQDNIVKEDLFIRQFVDNFIWIDENGNLSMFWPDIDHDRPNQHIQYLTEALRIDDEAEAEDIYKTVTAILTELVERKKLSETTGYHIISPALVNSLYFSPELMYIDFISEKNLRFKIWKHALQNTDPKYMFNGILTLLIKFGFSVEKVISTSSSSQSGTGVHVVALKSRITYKNKTSLPLYVVFSVTTANLTEDQVEQTYKMLRKLYREKGIIPQIVVFVYQGEMLERAKNRILELREEYLSSPLFINVANQITRLQLVSIGLVLRELGIETPVDINKKIIRIISGDLSQEEKNILHVPKFIAISDTLQSTLRLESGRMIEVLETFNILIPPLIRTLGKRKHPIPEKSLKAGLKYFLVVPEAHENGVTLERALKYSEYAIRRWYFFSQKGGLLGDDIESERDLEQRAELLVRNGYLDKIPRGDHSKYRIIPITSVEDKILQFIKRYGNQEGVSKILIENYFIEEQEGTLGFILDIMKEKGLILVHQEGSFVKISTVNKDAVTEEYQKINKTLEKIKNSDLDTIKHVGYFCDSKERGIRIKHVPTFITEIERFIEKAEEYLNSSMSIDSLSKSMFFIRLSHDLLLLYDDARVRKEQRKYKTLISQSERHMQSIVDGYRNILESTIGLQKILQERLNSKVIKTNVKVNLKEISHLKNLYLTLTQIYEEEYDRIEYETLLEDLWSSLVPSRQDKRKAFPFYYNKPLAEELEFNYKIYKMYEQIGVTLLNRHPPIESRELEEILELVDRRHKIIKPSIEEEIEKIIQDIDTTLEKSISLSKKARELREKLSMADELEYLSEYIPDVKSLKIPAYSSELTSIEETKAIVSRWKEQIKIELFLTLMNQLESVIDKIIKSKKSVETSKEDIQIQINNILQSVNNTTLVKSAVKDEINFLENLLDNASTLERSIYDGHILQELQRELSTNMLIKPDKKLEIILNYLNKYYEEISSIEREYARIIDELEQHINKMNSKIKDKLIEPRLKTSRSLSRALENLIKIDPLNSSEGICERAFLEKKYRSVVWDIKNIQDSIVSALDTRDYEQVEHYILMLNDCIEPLQTLIQCYLTREEQEVFLEYLKIKNMTQARLTLKEFIEMASKNLKRDIKDTFFRLVEKDIIMLYI